MGILFDIFAYKASKKRNKRIEERDIEEAEKRGEEELKRIEEIYINEKGKVVPKVDLSSPVEIPKGCKVNEYGEFIRNEDNEEERDN